MRGSIKWALAWATGTALYLTAVYQSVGDEPPKDKLPTQQAVQSAQLTVREVFRDDYRRSDLKGREDLLHKIWAQANDPKNDASVQYAMLLEAANIATLGGNADMLILISDELAQRYPHASLEVRQTILNDAVRSARSAEVKRQFGDALISLSDDAAWAGEYTIALHAAEEAKPFVTGAYATEKAQVFRDIVTTAAKVKDGIKDSKDAVRIGEFLCFGTGQWELGLPMLAKCDDEALATVAVKEAADPKKPDDAIALADRYLEIARTRPRAALVRSGAASRAAWWYERTLPQIGGLARIYAEKKLAEARQMSVWVTRPIAIDGLRTALLSSKWGWHGPDVQMTFFDDGTLSHRGMHGRWKIISPCLVLLSIDNGDTMHLHFNVEKTHYTSLTRGFGGDRLGN